MLALVSSSSASAIGRLVRLKNVTSCLTPSSKTLKSSCLQVGDVARRAVGDGDVQRHDIDAGAERGRLLAGRRLAAWRRLLRRRRVVATERTDAAATAASASTERALNAITAVPVAP